MCAHICMHNIFFLIETNTTYVNIIYHHIFKKFMRVKIIMYNSFKQRIWWKTQASDDTYGKTQVQISKIRKLFLDGMECLWGKVARRLGKWLTYVYFGQSGRKGID